MPALSNARHEKYAQALAKGLSADEAYQEAGFTANRGNACRLKANESVLARLAELQERAAVNVSLSREWVIEQLIDNVKKAKGQEKPDLSSANRALELLGKEQGMFVERTENVNVNHVVSDEPLTEDEWREEHATH